MRQRLRSKLTYANVVATLAMFLVIAGGTATAALVVSSNSQIGPGTISGHKPPSGKHANIIAGSINGQDTADTLRLECSTGSRYFEGACIETSVRSPKTWDAARIDCFEEGKRLPSVSELNGFAQEPGVTLGTPGEWSDHSYFVGTTEMAEVVQEEGRSSVHIAANNTVPRDRCVRLAKR
jgi:hypothetical protein